MIAGTHSGCGKTTITCAILAALKARNMKAASFKCGPDYIDPMFHRRVIGVEAHNLDSFFCNDDTLKYLLYESSQNTDISIIEGVMGFYDGVEGRGSAHSVSTITETPVVMVIDCKGSSESIGAMMKGFLEYKKPNMITGSIFNRLPERLVPRVKEMCRELDTEFLGYMPTNSFTIESRKLGLVTADEITDFKENPEILEVEEAQEREYKLTFESLRSNCRVTHQPDFGDAFIYYRSKKHIKEDSLVKYLTSFRSEYHFHEECCEMIFKRLLDILDDGDKLFISALYTRRGGIDISPVRSNCGLEMAKKLLDVKTFARYGIKQ
jgi:cobyrinic acid a,c-diamide synthase